MKLFDNVFLDLTELFEPAVPETVTPKVNHPTARACSDVAEKLVEMLQLANRKEMPEAASNSMTD